ncbi:MAG: DUF2752 domain-containing protein [Sphingobacteriales bacterium]
MKPDNLISILFRKYFELVFWIAALISLALTDPASQAHFSLCPLKLLGITWCPGCGLGHAISFLFHGDLKSSFHTHWLGMPALLIILYRIYVLVKQRFFSQLQINRV